jgi:hypothetical protein
MKTLRIVLGILTIIPLGLLADKIFLRPTDYDEQSLRGLAYSVVGVPILIFNIWAWVYPEIIEFYLFGKELQNRNN